METLCAVTRKDMEKCGDYHTKSVILEPYDTLAASIRAGHPCQTRFDPPPADSRCCHAPPEEGQP